MTITALNYAANARRALDSFLESGYFNDPATQVDKRNVQRLAASMDRAVQFVLPDGAQLFEDNLRGIVGQRVRLPYPVVVLEYHVNPEQFENHPGTVYAKKIVAVAIERNSVELGAKDAQETAIEIYSLYENGGAWIVNPTGFLVSGEWDNFANAVRVSPLSDSYSDCPSVVGRLKPLLHRVVELTYSKLGRARAEVEMHHNISSEVYAVLSFCEAMLCLNVSTETVAGASPSVNARRIKSGKLPLLETKVLTVNVPGASSVRIGAGRKTGEIRQHLRRGHIRNLSDGRRIWVNSCVVGNPERGRIEKCYRVNPEPLAA